MKISFIPPRPSASLIRLAFSLYEPTLLIRERVRAVHLPPEDEERLLALKGQRALLLCNHPSLTEPPIVFGLSKRLNEPFYYVASLDLFQLMPWLGFIMNRLGAFSIMQGGADRESLRMCQEILVERNAKLVILPEGEPNTANDRMHRWNPGAIQTGFWAAEKLVKVAKESGTPIPTLPVVPIAIKYCHVGDPTPRLEAGLRRVEEALGYVPPYTASLSERVCRGALRVLTNIEREYGLKQEVLSTEERIARVFNYIEARVTTALNARRPTTQVDGEPMSPNVWVRALFNLAYTYRESGKPGTSVHERKLLWRRKQVFNAIFPDLRRFENFMGISADMLGEPTTTERIGELLLRLEKEVLGKPLTFPLREAYVRIGEPVNLVDLLPEYRSAKRETVTKWNTRIEETVRKMLQEMQKHSHFVE